MISKNIKYITNKKTSRIIINIVLLIISLISLYPLYWMIVSTFSPQSEIFHYPPRLFPTRPVLENVIAVVLNNPFFRNLMNSFLVSIGYVVLTLFFCSLAGYAFAKFDFPFKNTLFILIIVSYAIPFAIQLIPLFILMVKIKWENNLLALFIPWVANAFGIFLMRQNIMGLPDDILAAARIDGCSEFAIYFRIVLPNLKPALFSLGIVSFITIYNDFLWPLIVIQNQKMSTLPLLLASLGYKLRLTANWGEVIAGCFLVTLPMIIVFLIFQKNLISGILGGAIKE